MKFDQRLSIDDIGNDAMRELQQHSRVANELEVALSQGDNQFGAIRRSYGAPVLVDELKKEFDNL